MEIGNTYYAMCDMDQAIRIYETIIRSLDEGYMDVKNAEELKLINLANLARPLGKLGRYEEALAKTQEGLAMAVGCGDRKSVV